MVLGPVGQFLGYLKVARGLIKRWRRPGSNFDSTDELYLDGSASASLPRVVKCQLKISRAWQGSWH
jgi:hypothetical protein